MYADFNKVYKTFKNIGACIGLSELGREIMALKIGDGRIIIQGGIHAREHITSELIIDLALYNLEHSIADNITFIPLVNPDGVELCLYGTESVPKSMAKSLTLINGGQDFTLWKANARAVDLNLNFPAFWGKGLGNIKTLASKGYIGTHPLSEKESKCLADYTNLVKPILTFSFHAKGEELYYGFNGVDYDSNLTLEVSQALSYKAFTTPNSAGGYKDWCVYALKIPSYTVEFGRNDLSYLELYKYKDDLFKRCLNLLKLVAHYDGKRVE